MAAFIWERVYSRDSESSFWRNFQKFGNFWRKFRVTGVQKYQGPIYSKYDWVWFERCSAGQCVKIIGRIRAVSNWHPSVRRTSTCSTYRQLIAIIFEATGSSFAVIKHAILNAGFIFCFCWIHLENKVLHLVSMTCWHSIVETMCGSPGHLSTRSLGHTSHQVIPSHCRRETRSVTYQS